MDEIPRDFSRDDLKMSQEQIAERDAGRARLAKLFPVAESEMPDPFQVNRSLNDFKSHVTAVLSDVLAELRIMRDSTKGSLAEQVAYELRRRAGSTGAPDEDVEQMQVEGQLMIDGLRYRALREVVDSWGDDGGGVLRDFSSLTLAIKTRLMWHDNPAEYFDEFADAALAQTDPRTPDEIKRSEETLMAMIRASRTAPLDQPTPETET